MLRSARTRPWLALRSLTCSYGDRNERVEARQLLVWLASLRLLLLLLFLLLLLLDLFPFRFFAKNHLCLYGDFYIFYWHWLCLLYFLVAHRYISTIWRIAVCTDAGMLVHLNLSLHTHTNFQHFKYCLILMPFNHFLCCFCIGWRTHTNTYIYFYIIRTLYAYATLLLKTFLVKWILLYIHLENCSEFIELTSYYFMCFLSAVFSCLLFFCSASVCAKVS